MGGLSAITKEQAGYVALADDKLRFARTGQGNQANTGMNTPISTSIGQGPNLKTQDRGEATRVAIAINGDGTKVFETHKNPKTTKPLQNQPPAQVSQSNKKEQLQNRAPGAKEEGKGKKIDHFA